MPRKAVSLMMIWLQALRIHFVIFGGMVTIIAYRLAHQPVNWFVVLVVMAIVFMTYAINTCEDRFHDIGKSQNFAYEHSDFFLGLSSFTILINLMILIAFSFFEFFPIHVALELGVLFLIGCFYSGLRKYSCASVTSVMIAWCAVAALPAIDKVNAALINFPFLFSLAGLTLSVETMHDLIDRKIDTNYKMSIPVRYGKTAGQIVVFLGVLMNAMAMFLVFPWAAIAGLICFMPGIAFLASPNENSFRRAQICLFCGNAVEFLVLFISLHI